MRGVQKMWVGLLFALLGIFAAGSVLAEEGCKSLLQNKCASCHLVNYICPKMESNSGVIYWKWVMHTMIKEGAELSDQESAQLVSCLSSRDAQARSFCPQKP
ncbi:MAG: hypothetical protein GXY53_03470 [Desulfobulbus sp.]|nr:hypothetical protein [Desulfobulbus sp.]